MLRFRQPRIKNERHLRFIRQLPCLVCFDDTCTEAAHVRYADPRACKRYVGKGEKPDDRWAVPLCGKDHRLQHTMDEEAFWNGKDIDPIFIALALYGVSGDVQTGEEIVRGTWRI